MDDRYVGILWIGSLVLVAFLLLAGALIPAERKRGLSDWALVVGSIVSAGSLFVVVLLGTVIGPPSYSHGPGGLDLYDLWQQVVTAAFFGVSGGLMVFGGGFVLSRAERRRRRMQEELLESLSSAHSAESEGESRSAD